MIHQLKKLTNTKLLAAFLISPVLIQNTISADVEDLPVLDRFIVEQSAAALADTMMPTERDLSGIFGDLRSILDVPRSVTLISPQIMEQFNIQDFGDLVKFGAGTQQANFYGVAGTPQIRGEFGGAFFNGMLRAFNRNERPLSFGSLEALEIIKGPTPADFDATHVGGAVNMIPKSPFFDRRRGSASVEVGSWNKYRFDGDVGGPVLLPGDTPAAYRVSFTAQLAESYYDDVNNDFASIYAAIKVQPSDSVQLFTGVEFFEYRSNENLGFNRLTQDLIDNGRYIIGQGVDVTSPAWGGFADRDVLINQFFPNPFAGRQHVAFGAEDFFALAVPTSVVDQAVSEGRISGAQRALLLDLRNDDDLRRAYGDLYDDYAVVQDAFRYTREYIDSGGEVFTAPIADSNTLSDKRDFADSTNFFWFGDLDFSPSEARTITWKNIFEYLETSKNSSHGYGFYSEQVVFDTKLLVREREWIPNSVLSYGANLRYHFAKQLQDFATQPYTRRDLLAGATGNDFVFAGALRNPQGQRLWVPGASRESETISTGIFGTLQTDWTDRFSTLVAVRGDYADFDVDMPSEVDLATPAQIQGRRDSSGSVSYLNFSINPSFRINEGVSIYAAYQQGTSVTPTQAGVIDGENSFNDSELIEVGLKMSLLDNRLFSSIAYYQYEQSSFDEQGGAASEREAEGFELEFTYVATENLTFIGSVNWQEVTVVNGPGFRQAYSTPQDFALAGSVQNTTTQPVSNVDRPGFPKTTAKLFGIYRLNEIGVSMGARWQEAFDLNYERTLKAPSATIIDMAVFYETDTWRLRVAGENIFSEKYFRGGNDPEFSSSILATRAQPASVSVTYSYFW